ncbi:MAG: CHAT domain-containing protein [Planctomycetes bacterium]|nr:CHAT domain-containing protein [Planctomycetota bacterium]
MPTVLLVAASPVDQDRLRLSNEVKQIKQALERSRNRENWTIETNEAVTVDDLRRALLDFRPAVVHFSGHGGGIGGLAFEDDKGETHAAQTEPLTKLVHHFKDSLKCVVLNACYSEVQATEIRQQIDYVVGMSRGIDDESATKFAVAFYDAVFAETTFRQAFDLACTAIDLNNLPDHDVPVFLTGPNLGGDTLLYTALIPQFEDLLLAYINAPYDQRYKFTTKGDAIREKMGRFYGEQLHTIVDKVTVVSTRQIDDEHWRIRSAVLVKGEKASGDHYLCVRDRSIQIEWEASVGYWSMPPKTYLALGTSEPIIARVRASLGTSYYGEFSDKRRQFQSVDLRTRDNRTLHGYVRRPSPEGKQLIELLSDGNRHDITVTIGNVCDETDHPFIHSVLSTSWLLPEENSA